MSDDALVRKSFRARYDLYGRCEVCNLQFAHDSGSDKALHQRYHGALIRALRPPQVREWHAGVLVIGLRDPVPLQRTAYALARLWKRELEYDTVPVSDPQPYTTRLYRPATEEVHFVAVQSGWAAAIAVTRRKLVGNRVDRDGVPQMLDERFQRPVIDALYTLPVLRGQGLGTLVLQAAAKHYGSRIADLAWSWPLSDAGAALAWKHNAGERWLWVA